MKPAPSHEACLQALLSIEHLLFDNSPGKRKREEQVKNMLSQLNDYEVLTTPLGSATAVAIRARDKGTCCDPGTERYWTM